MTYLDKSLPIKKRLYKVIYDDICAAIYSFGNESGIELSIKKINKSDEIEWWAKQCTKSVMEEYESTL